MRYIIAALLLAGAAGCGEAEITAIQKGTVRPLGEIEVVGTYNWYETHLISSYGEAFDFDGNIIKCEPGKYYYNSRDAVGAYYAAENGIPYLPEEPEMYVPRQCIGDGGITAVTWDISGTVSASDTITIEGELLVGEYPDSLTEIKPTPAEMEER